MKVLQRKEDDGRNLNILFSNGKIDPDDAIGVLARGRERESGIRIEMVLYCVLNVRVCFLYWPGVCPSS